MNETAAKALCGEVAHTAAVAPGGRGFVPGMPGAAVASRALERLGERAPFGKSQGEVFPDFHLCNTKGSNVLHWGLMQLLCCIQATYDMTVIIIYKHFTN